MQLQPFLAVLLLAPVSPGAAAAGDSGQALVTYEASVAGRDISGVSHSLQWKVTALAEGNRVELAVPIDSFESGHEDFDAALRLATQSARHPAIELDGIARDGRFAGRLSLAGVSRPLEARLALARVEGRLVLSTSFAIDLGQFGIALPQAGKRLVLDIVAAVPSAEHAIMSGGAVLTDASVSGPN